MGLPISNFPFFNESFKSLQNNLECQYKQILLPKRISVDAIVKTRGNIKTKELLKCHLTWHALPVARQEEGQTAAETSSLVIHFLSSTTTKSSSEKCVRQGTLGNLTTGIYGPCCAFDLLCITIKCTYFHSTFISVISSFLASFSGEEMQGKSSQL